MTEVINDPQLIVGAENIAQFLGLKGRKAIYNILKKRSGNNSDLPLWKEPGLGVVANRELLLRYMAERSGRGITKGK